MKYWIRKIFKMTKIIHKNKNIIFYQTDNILLRVNNQLMFKNTNPFYPHNDYLVLVFPTHQYVQ